MRAFEPLFKNPHILTILANFWPRKYEFARFPIEDRLIRTEPDTQVLVQTQRPVRRRLSGMWSCCTAWKAAEKPGTSAAWRGTFSTPAS